MRSIWIDACGNSADEDTYPSLQDEVSADVVVVGGGITGAATAMRLAEAGLSVALLEARRVGAGNTGRSTGNLYGTVSSGLRNLRKKWGPEEVACAVAGRSRALAWIRETAGRHGIDCSFESVPLHECVPDDDALQAQDLRTEHEAALESGLLAEWGEQLHGWPLQARRVHTLLSQAHFNPCAFTCGLVRELAQRGVAIYENSPVLEIDAGNGRVVTSAGTVRATDIVLATHTPLGFNIVQAEMEVFREYGIAARLGSEGPPVGSVWMKGPATRSIRTYRDPNGARYLVVVGEKHKTGEGERGVDYAERLRSFASEHFDIRAFTHQWSAQQYSSADGLPYIGASGHDNVFMATGMGADGLTWGVVASEVITDLVQGRDSPLSELLKPRRFTPIKSAKGWLAENKTTTRHLLERLHPHTADAALDRLPAGTGRLMDIDGEARAVYRDDDGAVTVLSPVCPHLKCHVHWNQGERTWDCPCHGSRFDTTGRVIEGPALQGLSRTGDG